MIANTESHEPKSSQEASETCLRPCFLRDNARAIGSFCISCVISSDLRWWRDTRALAHPPGGVSGMSPKLSVFTNC